MSRDIEWSGSGVEQKSGMSHLFNLSKIDCAGFQFSVIWDPKGVHFEVLWVHFPVNYFLFKSIWPWCDRGCVSLLSFVGKAINNTYISSSPWHTYEKMLEE